MLRVESPLSAELEELVTQMIDVGFTVHKVLGPGFREKIYAAAFRLELDGRGMPFESEKRILVASRARQVVPENHRLPIGLVMNFNQALFKNGLERVLL